MASSALDEAEALATDILDDARTKLMVAVRFLDVALWRMPYRRDYLVQPVATDGRRFAFDAVRTVRRFKKDPNEVVRDYLHTVLHCVFRHPFDDKHPETDLWDIACDVAVEATALELVGLRFRCEDDDQREKALRKLAETCPNITAHAVYKALLPAENPDTVLTAGGFSVLFVTQLATLFKRDDHSIWTRQAEERRGKVRFDDKAKLVHTDEENSVKGEFEGFEDDEDDTPPGAGVNMPGLAAHSTGGTIYEGEVENGDRFVSMESTWEAKATEGSLDDVEMEDYDDISWIDISKQIQMDLEAFTGKIGKTAGQFEVNLSVANRKTYDYRDFLKRFSSLSEELKVSTDEFDYVYYTYGLKMYRNMPLIEPLEYQESNRVREFVIAIDTSASCAGSLVKHFVEKTYDVLRSTSGFGRKINVHIIQCDSDIRKDVKITSVADIDESFAEFRTRGYGGTDFRPVFKYVNELVEKREFTNLKGLIYLTDGLGKFPLEVPGYETVFVFVTEDQAEHYVPPWAMKVVMTDDEILEL